MNLKKNTEIKEGDILALGGGYCIKLFSGNIYYSSSRKGYLREQKNITNRKQIIPRRDQKITFLYPSIRTISDRKGRIIAKRKNKNSHLIITDKQFLNYRRQKALKKIYKKR